MCGLVCHDIQLSEASCWSFCPAALEGKHGTGLWPRVDHDSRGQSRREASGTCPASVLFWPALNSLQLRARDGKRRGLGPKCLSEQSRTWEPVVVSMRSEGTKTPLTASSALLPFHSRRTRLLPALKESPRTPPRRPPLPPRSGWRSAPRPLPGLGAFTLVCAPACQPVHSARG